MKYLPSLGHLFQSRIGPSSPLTIQKSVWARQIKCVRTVGKVVLKMCVHVCLWFGLDTADCASDLSGSCVNNPFLAFWERVALQKKKGKNPTGLANLSFQQLAFLVASEVLVNLFVERPWGAASCSQERKPARPGQEGFLSARTCSWISQTSVYVSSNKIETAFGYCKYG